MERLIIKYFILETIFQKLASTLNCLETFLERRLVIKTLVMKRSKLNIHRLYDIHFLELCNKYTVGLRRLSMILNFAILLTPVK